MNNATTPIRQPALRLFECAREVAAIAIALETKPEDAQRHVSDKRRAAIPALIASGRRPVRVINAENPAEESRGGRIWHLREVAAAERVFHAVVTRRAPRPSCAISVPAQVVRSRPEGRSRSRRTRVVAAPRGACAGDSDGDPEPPGDRAGLRAILDALVHAARAGEVESPRDRLAWAFALGCKAGAL